MEKLQDLVHRAKAGDREATDRLFALSHEYSLRLVRKNADPRILAKEECEDMGSSVARELVRDFPKFEFQGEAGFYAYLAAAVDHKIKGKAAYWMAQRRDLRRETPIDDAGTGTEATTGPSLVAADTDPAIHAQRVERDFIVDEEIARLPEVQRTVMQLYRDEVTDAAIGERIGKTRDQVRYLRETAWETLRGRLRLRLRSQPPGR